MAGDSETDRASRMVDIGLEEAEITYNLGPPATEDDIRRMREALGLEDGE